MPHYQRNIRFILFFLLPLLAFFAGWSLNYEYANNTPSEEKPVSIVSVSEKNEKSPFAVSFKKLVDPASVNLKTFWNVWNTLEANFLYNEKLDQESQVYGAIRGLVSSAGDDYTAFLDPKETQEFELSLSSEFQGIGAVITVKDQRIMIVSPLKGSPAESAGLKSKDIVLQINEESTYGLNSLQAALKIRGKKGTKVSLEVLRTSTGKTFSVDIVRDTIQNKTVEWEMLGEKVAYIELTQFSNDTAKEFKKAVNEILAESPKGLIIDLRNNGGGILEVCLDILNEFFSEKSLVITRGKKIQNAEEFKSKTGGALLDIPLVVLTNSGSASASEIFAGAVTDHNRGILIGEKTFGKGSVQTVIPFLDGSSIKVTIAEWITPKGHFINKEGIEPDEEIKDDRDFSTDESEDSPKKRALELLQDIPSYTSILEKLGAEKEQAEKEKTPKKL